MLRISNICYRKKVISGFLTKLPLKNMKDRNDTNLRFAQELKTKGHTCIYYMESYPVQIGWCKQEPCKYFGKNKDKYDVFLL